MKLPRQALVILLLACLSRTLPAFECEGIATAPGDEITAELVVSGLSSPVDIQRAPGDPSRLYVVEQRGRIRIINLANDSLVASSFLDITSRVRSGGERGLLGLAFHPDFQQNGFLYVNYTNSGGTSVIARYRATSATSASSNTEQIVLTVSQPYSNHNAGQLAFSPRDGYLYIGFGDGGSGGDPGNRAQNGRQLLGKMLRIDVDSDAPYGIPASNPFTNNGSVRDEVWAIGLRNPWRFSFDPETHDLYIGDVGQNAWEEIDFQPASSTGGENYEWKVREGNHSYSGNTAYGAGERTGALYEYRHSGAGSGCSLTGGVVYRGCLMPDLHGVYFFADYCTNWIRTLRVQNGVARDVVNRTADLNRGIAGSIREISSFGLDGSGEVYIADHNGRIYRVIPVNPPDNPPNARITTNPDPAVLPLKDGFAIAYLDASDSDDGDGGEQELSFAWEKIVGPEGDTIGRPNKESTAVTFFEPGEYTYEVTVSDGNGQDTARVDVTIEGDNEPGFRRGDSNTDATVDLSDGVHVLSVLFLGVPGPDCSDASDSTNDGNVDVTDAILLFNYLFLGGTAPAAPGPVSCGPDTGEDDLDCASYNSCD